MPKINKKLPSRTIRILDKPVEGGQVTVEGIVLCLDKQTVFLTIAAAQQLKQKLTLI